MSDVHDMHAEAAATGSHSGKLLSWASSHKWIVGGVGAAVVLGLWSAHKNAKTSDTTGQTASYDPTASDYDNTGGTAPVVDNGGSPPVYTPPVIPPALPPVVYTPPPTSYVPPTGATSSNNSGTTAGISVGASVPVVFTPVQSGTHSQPIATGPNSGQLTTVSNVSTEANPGLGTGGGNYYTGSAKDAAEIADEQKHLAAGDLTWIASEVRRSNSVIANRQAAGLDIADEQDYLRQLQQAQEKALSKPSSGATAPSGALGTYTPPASSSSSSSSGSTSSSSSSSSSSVSSSGNPSKTDYQSNSNQQVVQGHTNPYYDSGNRISQDEYKQLSAQVAQGGAAGQAALQKLSGARVV